MTDFHVVFRVENLGSDSEQWSSYSFPEGIYTVGTSFAEIQERFGEVADFAFGDECRQFNLIRHVEFAAAPDIYVRVAYDGRKKERENSAGGVQWAVSGSAEAAKQRAEIETNIPLAASGDRVFVACVGDDPIRWVLDQMAPDDAVGVCMAGPAGPGSQFFAWSFLGRERVDKTEQNIAGAESLSDADLAIDSTIGELISSSLSGKRKGVLVGSVA